MTDRELALAWLFIANRWRAEGEPHSYVVRALNRAAIYRTRLCQRQKARRLLDTWSNPHPAHPRLKQG